MYAIEYCPYISEPNYHWVLWKKYKSIQGVLQALGDLRTKEKDNTYPVKFIYRPIHFYDSI